MKQGRRIFFRGVVQGVGFRPAVYRVASAMNLDGTVANTPAGVSVLLQGDDAAAEELVSRLRNELPDIARIDDVSVSRAEIAQELTGFHILESEHGAEEFPARISPDVAICTECLEDMHSQHGRTGYFLTNCTNCGPRFSIVTAIPYDRSATTMAGFDMCGRCRHEYEDCADRRFHAQPVACHDCGPRYRMDLPDGSTIAEPQLIVSETARRLRSGEIVMVKGIGGYNLIADARRDDAVKRLRDIKKRPRKPFAVMAGSVEDARKIADVTGKEEDAMQSWRAPIVVCQSVDNGLSSFVAPGCRTIGVMLPYMGFHHALFEEIDFPVVFTSANLPGCPIMIDDREAESFAGRYGIACVSHERPIANRCDDSVVRIIDGMPAMLRRSRGYVPEPLRNTDDVSHVAGMGADITSAWAFGAGKDIILSPYIGSLTNEDAVDALRDSINGLGGIFRFNPEAVVTDAHPAYLSSECGREYASHSGARIINMWHHHAHAVSVIAEYGITEKVLAVVLDGTGAGPDGTVWGSELLLCDRAGFERIAHGQYFPLPGGDVASLEPWRSAVAVVVTLLGSSERLPAGFRATVGEDSIKVVEQMIAKQLRCPQGCGAGRVWDAVAALLGVAYVNGYEAEAPVLLENLAAGCVDTAIYCLNTEYPLDITPIIKGILDDMEAGASRETVAARFHRSYARAWAAIALEESRKRGITTVVLGGGVMQNALLVKYISEPLRDAGLTVLAPLKIPAGDGGIAVGQVAHGGEILKRERNA